MDNQDLFTIGEAVVNFLGLRAEDWLSSDEFGFETYYDFRGNTIALAMENQLIADAQQVDSEFACYLGGVKADNPLNAYRVFEVKFPKEAFYNWWKENNRGLKRSPWFDDLINTDNLDSSTVDKEETFANENDLEVIEGLTVGDLREYLTDGSGEYLPRLLAVLRAKQKIIQERESRDSVGFKKFGTVKNPLKTLAENLVIEELKKVGIANVSDVDKKAVSRILLKEIDPPSGRGGTY